MTANVVPKYESSLSVPFADVLDYWDDFTEKGKNITAIRALAMWDRFFLLVQICGRVDMLHPWLYARCREVEADPDGYLDLWAREHYKSTIITYAGIIQEILRNPEITIGIFSHTAPIAKSFLRQIRHELERNEKLKKLFPSILWESPQQQALSWSLDSGVTVKRKTNPKEATIEASGLIDGMPTSKHYQLMVYDDVVVRESVNTPEQITRTTEMWELSDNLGVAEGGRKWHIGTRYSFADTYESIMKRGAVKIRIYPATDDGSFTGKPVFLTEEANDTKKITQGEATYSCQMLQNPLAGQNRMFNVEDIQEYEVRPETLTVHVMCDPARSKKRDSAKTAMVVIGLDYAMNKYLLDGFNHKMDLKERWDNFSFLYKKWKFMTGVQQVKMGYESFGAQADLDYFQEQMRLPSSPRFDVVELAWPREGDGSKVDRVQRLGPDLRTHKIFVPYPTNDKALTSNQRRVVESGYDFRVARSIRRKDENGAVYDITADFRNQIHYFPYGGLKDVVDAFSRIYDMEPIAPRYREPQYLEPEFV